MEKGVVTPTRSLFYKRYVEDAYERRKKNEGDELFNSLNFYHKDVRLTLEIYPTKFLDTKAIRIDNVIKTNVHIKNRKFAVHFTSKIPTKYNRNAIIDELRRAKKISTDFKFKNQTNYCFCMFSVKIH